MNELDLLIEARRGFVSALEGEDNLEKIQNIFWCIRECNAVFKEIKEIQ